MPCCCSACSPPTTAIVIMKTFTTSGNLLEIEPDKKPAQTNYLCVHFDIISHYWCGPRRHKLLDTTAISRNISEYHENPIFINHLDIKQDRINSNHCPTLPPSPQYSSVRILTRLVHYLLLRPGPGQRGTGNTLAPLRGQGRVRIPDIWQTATGAPIALFPPEKNWIDLILNIKSHKIKCLCFI